MPSTHLMAELRETTRDAHQRLEALPFASALAENQLPLESYVGYLRVMAVIHSVLEHELPVEADERIDRVWSDDMRRLPALRRDLGYFSSQAVRDITPAHSAVESVANRLLQRSVEAPLSMLGYLYVLEGSRLGAIVLSKMVKRTFGLQEGRGLVYLEGHGDETQTHWEAFRTRMNDIVLSTEERQAIVDTAVEAFEGIHKVIEALYPFDTRSLALKATSLNPEAGSHLVPQDLREIEAAQRATERCLLEYPYFVWRYGERGRRFTDSDGAWLVVLTQYPQARIEKQIAWLGGVLATRGMPRVLLQRHLELLYEELLLKIPDKEKDYAKLLSAANRLVEQRRMCITDEAMDDIRQRFDRAAGAAALQKLSGTAVVLIGAVVDEHSGHRGALDSVREWHTDSIKFPADWIDAVNQCISDAESALLTR